MTTFEHWQQQASRPGASMQVKDCVAAWEEDRKNIVSRELHERLLDATLYISNAIADEKNARLQERIDHAYEIIKAGVEIMDTEQVGQWYGVRTWMETKE